MSQPGLEGDVVSRPLWPGGGVGGSGGGFAVILWTAGSTGVLGFSLTGVVLFCSTSLYVSRPEFTPFTLKWKSLLSFTEKQPH